MEYLKVLTIIFIAFIKSKWNRMSQLKYFGMNDLLEVRQFILYKNLYHAIKGDKPTLGAYMYTEGHNGSVPPLLQPLLKT